MHIIPHIIAHIIVHIIGNIMVNIIAHTLKVFEKSQKMDRDIHTDRPT
jgi:hypothetical protein